MLFDESATRRAILRSAGAAVTATAIPAGVQASTDSGASEWTAVESPTGNTLSDVEYTSAGAYAVGGGAVFDRGSRDWNAQQTPTGANLKAVLRGDTDIAVGAGGAVIER